MKPALCTLIEKVFARHGRHGTNTLHNVRPFGGRRFRDGLQTARTVKRGAPVEITYLWYEELIKTNSPYPYTSRMVRTRSVIR